MSEKLSRIFDYQRFAGNKKLEKMINETQEKYAMGTELALSEADLAMVFGGKKNLDVTDKSLVKDKEK